MELQNVKRLLKDGYETAGFDVVDESADGETILRYPQPEVRDITLKITADDAQEYSELLESAHKFRTVQEVGIATQRFREQLLLPLDANFDERDLRKVVIRCQGSGATYAEVDKVSLVYANYFRFVPGYMKLCLDRLFSLSERKRRQASDEPLDIRYMLARPPGIRVFDIEASGVEQAVRLSNDLIENSLFTLAYEYDIPLMRATAWPPSRFERHQHIRHKSFILNDIVIPDADFPGDLARLYQAGVAATIPAHQFLSFFQILEFFFQEVDYARIYDELFSLLSSEEFSPDYRHLGQVISLIESYRSGLTTTDMLEQLLWTHVSSAIIQDQIKRNGRNAEEAIGTLAHRLSVTHEAIIHAGTVSLPLDSPTVTRDVPLVKFLAEQVILAARGG